MLRRVRVLFVLLALVILAAGVVEASPRVVGPKPLHESAGVLDRLWNWFSSLLPGDDSGSGRDMEFRWEEEGSHWDPNGEP